MLIKPNKVVIDTNIWVSFLLQSNFREIDFKIISGEIKLLFSPELLEELLDVIHRPRLKKHFSENIIDRLLNLLNNHADFVTVSSNLKLCRDPKDDFLLSLAHDAKADYLITGDDDLLIIGKINDTEIITIRQFLESL